MQCTSRAVQRVLSVGWAATGRLDLRVRNTGATTLVEGEYCALHLRKTHRKSGERGEYRSHRGAVECGRPAQRPLNASRNGESKHVLRLWANLSDSQNGCLLFLPLSLCLLLEPSFRAQSAVLHSDITCRPVTSTQVKGSEEERNRGTGPGIIGR
ncbi:hypothetical protein N656DRAFT_54217 [Canariomyces notabilis]|uniref:Uncharacterized protein n=1 Tax=Canariomyces notabilis TaxID=2074819 RepID=A0AAN6TNF6_9PEZI|nr:hypothetical protein N656DRAFT_54217 [Canariomyces arenarius]